MTHAERLLVRVRRRLQLRAAGRAFGRWLPAVALAWLLLLVMGRLLGAGPDLPPWTVSLVPAAAALLGLLTRRHPGLAQAATATDACAGSHDLFLTSIWLARAPGEFGPLVAARADERARGLRAETVVPLRPWPGLGLAGALLLALFAAVSWLPRAAPDSGTAARQAEVLQQQRREAERKVAALREQQVTEPNSPSVTAAVAELQRILQQTQRTAVADNKASLQDQQRQFGDAWRAANRAAAHGGEASGAQEFGSGMDARMKEWKRDLERGQADALRQELEQLQARLGNIGHSPRGERAEQLQQLGQQLEKLADLASAAAAGGPADQALQQALQQMQSLVASDLDAEAMQALQQSLELAKLEFSAKAQGVRDRQALEEALRAMQLASRLNDLGELDGKACGQCKSLADYEALYAQRMQERLASGEPQQCAHCNGTGQCNGQPCAVCGGAGQLKAAGTGAFGGQGIGQGGKAPEDPSTQTAFQTELSRGALGAGRMLMLTNGKGVAEGGEPQRAYEALQQVKQGATEAILQERVPPGYHSGIRKYFDELSRPKR
jgi:hypothetical protein